MKQLVPVYRETDAIVFSYSSGSVGCRLKVTLTPSGVTYFYECLRMDQSWTRTRAYSLTTYNHFLRFVYQLQPNVFHFDTRRPMAGGGTATLELFVGKKCYYSGILHGTAYIHESGNTTANLFLLREEIDRLFPFCSLQEVKVQGLSFNMLPLDDHGHLFRIGEREVTQGLWQSIMGKNPTHKFSSKDEMLPVDNVSWDDCQQFLRRLNRLTSSTFRLPTEAEWAFAHTTDEFDYPVRVLPEGAYDEMDDAHTPDEEHFSACGLIDVIANTAEWCHDQAPTSQCRVKSSWMARLTDTYRVARTCQCNDSIGRWECPPRDVFPSSRRTIGLGLRLAMDEKKPAWMKD